MAGLKITHPLVVAGGAAALIAGFVFWNESGRPGLVTAVEVPPPSPPAATRQHIASLAAVERRWADTLEVASRTSRIALAPVVTDLQAQRRDAESADLGTCLEDLKPALGRRMELEIEDYLDFMSSDHTVFVEIERKDRAQARRLEAAGHNGTIDVVRDHCTAIAEQEAAKAASV